MEGTEATTTDSSLRSLYDSKEDRARRQIGQQTSYRLEQSTSKFRVRRMNADHVNEICSRPLMQDTQYDKTPVRGTNAIDDNATANNGKEDISTWTYNRQKQRAQIDSMGISESWLRSKVRCPLESECLSKMTTSKVDETLNNQHVENQYDKNPRNSCQYSFNQDKASTLASNSDQREKFKTWIQINRWRLHDLFSRCGITDNYKMSPSEILYLIEPVARLVPITWAVKHSIAFERALACEGTLVPMSSAELLSIIESFGTDRFGQLDYRKILDDYESREQIGELRQLDKLRRRRSEIMNESIPSIQECIAASIQRNQDSMHWLHDVGNKERHRRSQMDQMIRASRVIQPNNQKSFEMAVKDNQHSVDISKPHWRSVKAPRVIPERLSIDWPAKLQSRDICNNVYAKNSSQQGGDVKHTHSSGAIGQSSNVVDAVGHLSFLNDLKRRRAEHRHKTYSAVSEEILAGNLGCDIDIIRRGILHPND